MSLPNSGAVLIVEDPFVTGLLRNLLEKNGFLVVDARAQQALEMLRGGQTHFDVVITNRPSALREVGSRLPVLYLSACPDGDEVASFRTWISLRKPFQPRQLVDAVNELAGCGAVR